MSKIVPSIVVGKGSNWMGKLSLDLDSNAERFVVIDRHSMALLRHYKVPANGIATLLLPLKYATTPFIVGIVDDSGEYNVKMIDGVTCEIVNANLV